MKLPIVTLTLLILFKELQLGSSQYGNYDIEEEELEEPEDEIETETQPVLPVAEIVVEAINSNISIQASGIFKVPLNYSVHKPPPLVGEKPIPVEMSMLIFNLFDIKEIAEEIGLEINYKLYWQDTRLSELAKNIDKGQKWTPLSTTLLHKIWHPDIFIDHVKRVTQPQLISAASSLRFYNDGSLRYTARILLVLTCRMQFHFYPADTQECNVTLKSFAYSTAQINLKWRDNIGALFAKPIPLHNFDMALITHPDSEQATKSNNYSILSFGIKLRRKLSYHVIQTYVPSTLFTIVSWLSFLVPAESTPGRMAICVTTLLTVTAMFGATKANTPNVSYVKAIDIWMFMCIFFIFLSLMEFTLVLHLRSKKVKVLEESLLKSSMTTIVIQNVPLPPPTDPQKYVKMSATIENWAPRVFPLVFLFMTCLYWPILLIRSEYFSLDINPDMYYTV